MLAMAAFCVPRWVAALVARLPLAWHSPARTPCKLSPAFTQKASLSLSLFLPPSTVSDSGKRGFCPEALIRAEPRGKCQNTQLGVSRADPDSPRPRPATQPPPVVHTACSLCASHGTRSFVLKKSTACAVDRMFASPRKAGAGAPSPTWLHRGRGCYEGPTRQRGGPGLMGSALL